MTRCRTSRPCCGAAVSLLGLRELTLVPVIVLVIVIGAFASDAFLTTDNFLNILQQSSELSVVVIAETLILLAGKFDLSLESVVGLAPMLGAWLIIKNVEIGGSGVGLAWWLAIPVVLLTGAVVGAINGFLIVRLRLNAFIVTLAMLILLRGVQLGTTSGKTLFDLPGRVFVSRLRQVDRHSRVDLDRRDPVHRVRPVSALPPARPRVVRHRRQREAARVAGVRVDRVLWGTFIVAGMLAALAGLMLTGRIASVVPSQGQNMIFYVFAAAVIGGISLNGGKGRLLGALTGVLLLGILQNVLTLAEIPAFWIDAVYGAIILIALVVSWATGGTAEET